MWRVSFKLAFIEDPWGTRIEVVQDPQKLGFHHLHVRRQPPATLAWYVVWGVQDLLPAYTAKPHLLPRKTTSYKVGDPVDLSDLMGKPSHQRGAPRGDRPDHGGDHRASSRTSAARRRPP